MKTAIMVDSTMPTIPGVDYQNVYFVDLLVNINGQDHYASTLDMEKVNKSVNETGIFPKTSLPPIKDIEKTFTKVLNDGYDRLFVITLSSGLSGTFQTVEMFSREFMKDNKIDIYCIDSKRISVGNAICLDYLNTILLANKNQSSSDIMNRMDILIAKGSMHVILDKLDYAYKGGRLSRTQFMASEFFNIRPLLIFDNEGKVEIINKVRGLKRLFRTIINYLEEDYKKYNKLKVYLIKADASDSFEKLVDALTSIDNFDKKVELVIIDEPIDAITGIHSGPNTIGLAWYPLDIE